MEGFVMGVLLTLVVISITALIFVVRWGRKKIQESAGVNKQLAEIFQWVKDRPQAIIHLDLKKVDADTKFDKIQLPITPSDFVVKAESLFEALVAKYEEEKKKRKETADLNTAAWCIITHSGLGEIIEPESKLKVNEALSRLLINRDEKGVIAFFRIVANSVCQAMIPLEES